MNSEIQQKIQKIVLVGALVLGVFAAYDATNYLREERLLNPVDYDRFDVVVLGDSITAGVGAEEGLDYVSLLRKDYPWAKIRNAGVSGDTTGEALERIEEDVLAYDPDMVVVFLGGNDVLHNMEPARVYENLGEIINLSLQSGAEVLLVSVPGGAFSDPFGEYFELLGQQEGVTLVTGVLDGILKRPAYLKDLIHPNTAGHQLIYERVRPVFGRMLQKYY
jgi:lysophospholipase L1-like esterase